MNSVISCCTTVITLNILSRGWLFTVGVRTDWPGLDEAAVVAPRCYAKPPRSTDLALFSFKGTPFPLCFSAFFVPFICESLPWRGCSLGSWMDGGSRRLRTSNCSMSVWTRCLLFPGNLCASCCQHTHAAGRLITICPCMAKLLTVIALCQAIWCLYASTFIDVCKGPSVWIYSGTSQSWEGLWGKVEG
jgi:hypothetical protein